jgi:CheY-like chemotaxis protein
MVRILVIEDDNDLQFIYDKALARLGHEITQAKNASEAIIYLTTDDFDAIILDMNMPDAPGTKILEIMKDDVRMRNIPVLVVSANEKFRAQAQEFGAEYFMVKPVPLQDLTDAIQDVLKQK